MTYTVFPTNVNKNFYEYSEEYEDNSVIQEYASGRKTAYLKNTRFTKKIKCKLSLKKGEEENYFNQWYTNTLGGVSGIFVCGELGNALYRFSSPVSFENKNSFKIVTMEIEEVY